MSASEAGLSLEEIQERIVADRIELVRFETPDLNGVSRGKSVAAEQFSRYVERGLALVSDIYCWDHECWVATGTGFGEDLTFADLTMRPDLSTFRVLPHASGQARVICDVEYSDGRPVEASPRRVLSRLVERAAQFGYTARMQGEYEFYLLDATTHEPPFGGTDITTTLTNQRVPVLMRLMRDLRALGLHPTTLNQEWGPTQYELNFDPGDGLEAGDLAFTYKTYAKDIAARDGHLLSFMTKPWTDRSGNSCHVHASLYADGANVFADPSGADGLSESFRWAVGGQLAHARALSAFFAPTVNCSKRFRKGTYAPASLSWGFENRSVAVRVKSWRDEQTHIENRLGCGSSNPYLVMAAMLAAMLDGIEQQTEPPEPIQTNAYHRDDLELVPDSLEESMGHLEADLRLRSYFHPEFLTAYAALKRHEIDKARAAHPGYGTSEWRDNVTDWERDQFLVLA
jgi:glutamine synthetase